MLDSNMHAPDQDAETPNEETHLLFPQNQDASTITEHGAPHLQYDAKSIMESHIDISELALVHTAIGERLAYNDYTTIDWLHDLVKDAYRYRSLHTGHGLRDKIASKLDAATGWVAAAIIGILAACVAFLVDVAVETVGDWKLGYCKDNFFSSRHTCCTRARDALGQKPMPDLESCQQWQPWASDWYALYGIYVAWALVFGIISSSLTMLTKSNMPATAPGQGDKEQKLRRPVDVLPSTGKSLYLAAGSGIPEIKTILSGFVIPHFLDLKVLVVKAVGAVFAVSTGMCLGKEGPFVHISTCVASLVSRRIAKYRFNGRKMREMLSTGCAAGISVAFGAPIGGVLFSYEEISTYFPRKVLWRAFFCSLWAAVILKALNPTGTGKLVLFETKYGTGYAPVHYLTFIVLGIAGGLWGGIFCKLNFLWSKNFRKYAIIKNNPVFEVFIVTLITAALQYPNPMARALGDKVIKELLQDCRSSSGGWVCQQETPESRGKYIGWLVHGTIIKLLLTIITFGCKVPSGIIIPALDAGAFFGRLIGQWIPDLSPGIFAMVGAAGFLAGVSRMTISLCVIMFELTGELEYVIPNMIAILVAKWVADALEPLGIYDLAQAVLGHPFLDLDHARLLIRQDENLVEELIPPPHTMKEITVHLPPSNKVPRRLLEEKLAQLKARGLMDGGLVLVKNEMLQGYLSEGELDFALCSLEVMSNETDEIRLLGEAGGQEELNLSLFVDKTPLTVCATAPIEYAVEMFGKLGLRYLCVVEEGSGKLVGVIIKKRLVAWLESLGHR